MKIAIDISQVIYGTGAARYTQHLVASLLELKTEHQFLLFGGSLRRKQELGHFISGFAGVESRTYHLSPRLAHLLWNTWHIVPVEKFIGPVDLVHTSDWSEPPARAPKVTTIHDLSFFVDPHFVQPAVRQAHKKKLFWVVKESAKIIAVSQFTKNDIVKYLNVEPSRIEVIYEGPTSRCPTLADTELASGTLKRLGITQPYLLVPGSGHPRKNIDRIVAAFTQTKLDYQLVITGLPAAAERKLAAKKIIFTGFVSAADQNQLTAHAQALIYPSLYEGFGLPILDAFVCRVPVLTSNLSSLPEIAADAAILVDPYSVDSIADGIIKVLDQPAQLVKRGTNRLKHFSWQKTAQKTLLLYEQVYADRHRRQ